MPSTPDPDPLASVRRSIAAAQRRAARDRDPLGQARAYGALLATLQEQVMAVTAERDAALMRLLGGSAPPSHRQLAAELGMSRQRVDQLARIAAGGGRERSLHGPR